MTFSITFEATPLAIMRCRSLMLTFCIRSSERVELKARRNSSASLPLKSAMTMAILSICS